MRLFKNNTRWLIAMFGSVCLVAAAVGVAQRQPAASLPHAQDARALSSVFRDVAREALPSVVSIEAKIKTVQQSRALRSPFGEDDSPFDDLFKNDPRFREFFRQLPNGQMPPSVGMGSGFIIDASGIIMTNSHVVNNAEEVIVTLHDGRKFTATDVKTDPQTDVAIVRIENSPDLHPISFGDSDAMQVGDWVLAVGSPFRMDSTVTHGIISGKGRGLGIAERESFLQTDAAINPGNSGGPLLNLNGEVIGINTAISTRSGSSSGVGFTIPSSMARWVAEKLIEEGSVKRAYLGVLVQPVDDNFSKQLKTPIGQGAVIRQVSVGSPADEAKLEPLDVILALDGKEVDGPGNLQRIVERLDIGKTYTATILRNGKRTDVPIKLRELPEEYTRANLLDPSRQRPSVGDSYSDLGIEIRELTPGIAKQLGLEEAAGVLVSSVKTGSPARLAGLKAGDVIEKVGSKLVNSPREFRDAMKTVSLKDGISFVVRDKLATKFVEVQVDR